MENGKLNSDQSQLAVRLEIEVDYFILFSFIGAINISL